MVVRQILYVSEAQGTQALDLPYQFKTVGELKRFIILNELRIHSKKKNNLRSIFGKCCQENFPNNLPDLLIQHFRLISCQKELMDSSPLEYINHHHTFHLKVRIVGGKGGFGATLKSQKANQNKITNYDA